MSVAAATRSEVAKQFTTNGWWIILLITIGYIAMMSFGLGAAFGVGSKLDPADAAGAGLPPISPDVIAPMLYAFAITAGYALPMLYGTLMVTSEFRHNLLVPTFLATPRRGSVILAKFIAGVLMGLIIAAGALLGSVGGGAGALLMFGMDTQLTDPDVLAMIGRIAVGMVLWTLIGIGLGTIIRNQVAAIVIVLAFTQFVEPLLRMAGMFVKELQEPIKYLPGAASDALTGQSLLSLAGEPVGMLEWWQGGIVLAAYAVVFALLGSLTTWRKDVS